MQWWEQSPPTDKNWVLISDPGVEFVASRPSWENSPFARSITWYGVGYAGTQMSLWDFQNKGTLTSPARRSFLLKVPVRYLRPSIIYSVPRDRIVQRAHQWEVIFLTICIASTLSEQSACTHVLLLPRRVNEFPPLTKTIQNSKFKFTGRIALQELNFLSILLLQWDKKFLSHILLQNNHIFSVVSKTVL